MTKLLRNDHCFIFSSFVDTIEIYYQMEVRQLSIRICISYLMFLWTIKISRTISNEQYLTFWNEKEIISKIDY